MLKSMFSFSCPGCGRTGLTADNHCFLCETCRRRLPLVGTETCPGCGGDLDGILALCANCLREPSRPWSDAVALMRFEGFGRELIHRFKYRQHPELARPLGMMAAARWRVRNIKVDYVVPMPLHWTRYLTRGFNQAELLAGIISRTTGYPVKKLLKRTTRTKQQARLSRQERRKNILAAFSVKREDICRNSSILLVDDVLTTGATLSEAAETLLRAGARTVKVLVLARGY